MTQTDELVLTKSWQGSRDPLFQLAKNIRFEVFVEEQKVPADVELDWIDDCCTHFLITLNDEPVGTMRVFDAEMFHHSNYESYRNHLDASNAASKTADCLALKVGRFAVREKFRSRGFGRVMMEFAEKCLCEQYAGQFAQLKLVLHSQTDKHGFYAKNGFQIPDLNVDGSFKQFLEENIWHVKMEKILNISEHV